MIISVDSRISLRSTSIADTVEFGPEGTAPPIDINDRGDIEGSATSSDGLEALFDPDRTDEEAPIDRSFPLLLLAGSLFDADEVKAAFHPANIEPNSSCCFAGSETPEPELPRFWSVPADAAEGLADGALVRGMGVTVAEFDALEAPEAKSLKLF